MESRILIKQIGLWLGIAVLLAACQAAPAKAPQAVIPVTAPTRAPAVQNIPPAVAVQDQVIKNATVAIDKVISTGSGWLVIYNDENGSPGTEIGRTGIHAGESDALVINIANERVTHRLYASLHVDRGVIGVYEFPGPDGPVIDDSGRGVASAFHVSLPSVAQTTAAAPKAPGPGLFTYSIPSKSDLLVASAPVRPAVVAVRETALFGRILMNGSGMTLYVFRKNAPNPGACSGNCQAYWRPLLTSGDPQGNSETAGNLGTITLSDGSLQVTYRGRPLYLYANDARPGDAYGQGIGDAWSVVDP
ncbi:MAG TPA: hypothetical protein VMT46_16470 [Anaerolineaceae bacterium]|nr:hypothetical protein [Anaerolineaceae bacterium]